MVTIYREAGKQQGATEQSRHRRLFERVPTIPWEQPGRLATDRQEDIA